MPVGRKYALVRKISQNTSGSYWIYLPMEWVKAQGLDRRNQVKVVVEFDKEKIVIRKFKEE